jgi:hypothetical protein
MEVIGMFVVSGTTLLMVGLLARCQDEESVMHYVPEPEETPGLPNLTIVPSVMQEPGS